MVSRLRTGRAVLAAMVVVALVLGVVAILVVVVGGDPPEGDADSADDGADADDASSSDQSALIATWRQESVEFSVLEGTVAAERLPITPVEGGPVPEARIDGPIGEVASVSSALQPSADGAGLDLLMTVVAPLGGAGVYTGEVLLMDADRPVSEPLGVQVTVVAPDGENIPDEVPIASPEQIEERPDGPYVEAELVIATAIAGEEADDLIRTLARDTGGQIVGSVRSVGLYQLRYPGSSADEIDDIAVGITDHPDVSVATPVALLGSTGGAWSRTDDPEADWEPLEAIGAPEAWAMGVTGQGIRIGVIDSHFAGGHEDLRQQLANWAFTWHEPEDCGSNRICHGTHVAGTACAAGNNARGVVGVAYDCSVLFYNYGPYFDRATAAQDSYDLVESTTWLAVADLMDRAARDGARAVNMSIGTARLERMGYTSRCEAWLRDHPRSAQALANDRTLIASTLQRLAGHAVNDEDYADTLFVFAAGNEDVDAARCSLIPYGVGVQGSPGPAGASNPDNMLAVGATDRRRQKADFSNYGDAVDVYAPGVGIHSASLYTCGLESAWWNPFDTGQWMCHDSYAPDDGTSMAAPHVTGAAALLFEANPDLSARLARACIRGTAEHAGGVAHLNVPRAVECAQRGGSLPLGFDALRSAPVPALCIHPAGRLVDGELPGIEPSDGYVTLRDVAAFGDVTGDADVDAVAAIGCSAGGVSWPDTVHVYGPGPVHLAALDLSDHYSTGWEHRESVRDLTVDDDTFAVTWQTHAPGDAMASASLVVHGTFAWIDDAPRLRDVRVIEDRRLPPEMPPGAFPHPDECRAVSGPSLDLVGWHPFSAMCLYIAFALRDEDLASEFADPPAIARLFGSPQLVSSQGWRFEVCGAERAADSWLGLACEFTVDGATIQFTYIAYDDISVINDVRLLP